MVAVLLVFATRAVAAPPFGLYGEFPPLTYGGLAFFTVILVSVGVLVFVACVKWSTRSIAVVLMVTHVAAWAPTLFVLTNRALIGRRV